MARQHFIGMVISTAMQKTVKVQVAREVMHPKVQKFVKKHKNFFAHDEKESCSIGDVVRIEACRPLSKMKSFTVAEIIRPAKTWIDPRTAEVKR